MAKEPTPTTKTETDSERKLQQDKDASFSLWYSAYLRCLGAIIISCEMPGAEDTRETADRFRVGCVCEAVNYADLTLGVLDRRCGSSPEPDAAGVTGEDLAETQPPKQGEA